MAKLIRPTIAPRPEVSVSTRPLPKALIDTYYQSESDFRKLISQIESNETFGNLVERGIVRRIGFQGRVPQHRYEEHKDEEMVRFFRRYDITAVPDWEADFFHSQALKRRQVIARKYKVPMGELLSVLRYTSYVNTLSDIAPEATVSTREDQDDFLQFTASDSLFDTGEVAEQIRSFVDRHGLDQEEFLDCFMGRELDVDEVLQRIDCSAQEVHLIQRLVRRIQVLSSFCIEVTPASQTRTTQGKNLARTGPVAEIHRAPNGLELGLHFLDDGIYTAKYSIDETLVRGNSALSREEQELISQMRAINQRKNVLHRLVTFLFRYQYRFFLSGNPLHLMPITQAAVAKAIFEEEATVSRLIRDKTIRTPEGVMTLKELCHKTSTTVQNLILIREREALASGKRDRPFTDREIMGIMRSEYGVELSRRSITYHRNRCLKQSNYYSRVRGSRNENRGSEGDGDAP